MGIVYLTFFFEYFFTESRLKYTCILKFFEKNEKMRKKKKGDFKKSYIKAENNKRLKVKLIS